MGFSRFPRWLGFATLLAALTGARAGDRPQPIFRLDLQSLGAVGLELPRPIPAPGKLAPIYPASFGFLDNSTLVISFAIWNSRTTLSTRSDEDGGTRLLHTAVVDLASGKVVAEKTWGTMQERDVVLPLSQDRLLVYSGSKLAIVSRDWRQEQTLDLGPPAPGETQRRLIASPTLRTLFLVTSAGPHREKVEVVETSNLTRVHELIVESVGLDAGSDSTFAYMVPGKAGYALFALPLKTLDKTRAASLDPVFLTQSDGCVRPAFIGDDTLVLWGACDAVTLIGTDGNLSEVVRLGGTHVLWATPTLSAQPAGRFILMVDYSAVPATEGARDPIRVYDTKRLHAVWELEDPPASPERAPLSDARLSPDGSSLAVLFGFDFGVYRLPGLATVSPEPPAPNPKQQTESPRSLGLQVSLISLADLQRDAIEAWVRISNHGATDIALDPRKATLEILGPQRKLLSALNPDRLAGNLRDEARTTANGARNICGDNCADTERRADLSELKAEQAAADVRRSALRAQTLKPGQQVQGTIYFAYQRKRGEAVLRIAAGNQVFELPARGK